MDGRWAAQEIAQSGVANFYADPFAQFFCGAPLKVLAFLEGLRALAGCRSPFPPSIMYVAFAFPHTQSQSSHPTFSILCTMQEADEATIDALYAQISTGLRNMPLGKQPAALTQLSSITQSGRLRGVAAKPCGCSRGSRHTRQSGVGARRR